MSVVSYLYNIVTINPAEERQRGGCLQKMLSLRDI